MEQTGAIIGNDSKDDSNAFGEKRVRLLQRPDGGAADPPGGPAPLIGVSRGSVGLMQSEDRNPRFFRGVDVIVPVTREDLAEIESQISLDRPSPQNHGMTGGMDKQLAWNSILWFRKREPL